MSGVTANPGVTPITPDGVDVGKLAGWTAFAATAPPAVTALAIGSGSWSDLGRDATRLPWKTMGRAALKTGAVGVLAAVEINLLRDIALPDSRLGGLAGGGVTGAVAAATGAVGTTAIITPSALRNGRAVGAMALGAAAVGYAIGSATGFASPDRKMLPF